MKINRFTGAVFPVPPPPAAATTSLWSPESLVKTIADRPPPTPYQMSMMIIYDTYINKSMLVG